MVYTNWSATTKTFHGVMFRPGETKEVSGIINDPAFVHASICKEPPTREEGTHLESETASVVETVEVVPTVEVAPIKRKYNRTSKSKTETAESDPDNSELNIEEV